MSYKRRWSTPTSSEKQYVNRSRGGISPAIVISNSYANGFTLPNCVGYVWGRIYELMGNKRPNFQATDAWRFYEDQNHGYPVGQTPKLGALAVWGKKPAYVIGRRQPWGHVAIVEDISSDGKIVYFSESNYMEPLPVRGTSNYFNPNKAKSLSEMSTARFPFLGYVYHPGTYEGNIGPGFPDTPGDLPGPGGPAVPKEGESDNYLLLHGNFY